jgi:hypothetical protein
MLNEIETLVTCTPAKVGESPEWISIVNSAEENRANFYKGLDGKPLFSALYGMYTVTLNELEAVSVQAKHSVTANKTSTEPTTQDDEFREVIKRTQKAKLKWKLTISQEVD